MTAKLTWDVFVGPPAPFAGDEARPSQIERTWSPISATLISGEHDSVLIDALLTADHARELADWVAARGKNFDPPSAAQCTVWQSHSVTPERGPVIEPT